MTLCPTHVPKCFSEERHNLTLGQEGDGSWTLLLLPNETLSLWSEGLNSGIQGLREWSVSSQHAFGRTLTCGSFGSLWLL